MFFRYQKSFAIKMSLVVEHKMISLVECKKILNADGLFYTDDEIIKLRDFLCHLADIAMNEIEKKTKKIVEIKR